MCGFLAVSLFILGLSPIAGADSNNDLVKAVEQGHWWQALKAIQKGASPEATSKDGRPVLVLAAAQCRLEMMDLLVSKGASVQIHGTAAWKAALGCSCSSGIAAFLVEKGMPLPTPGTDSCGRTPLMIAAEHGRADMVKSLLDGGAPPDVKDAEGLTAVYYAPYSEHNDIVKILVEQGHATPPTRLETVKDEHEVYIWISPTENSTILSRSRWKISGVLGKGDLRGTGSLMDPELILETASHSPGPAPGFEVWYVAPQNASDALSLEPGSSWGPVSGPVSFGAGSNSENGGGLFWLTTDRKTAMRLHPVLYPNSGGDLVLGGFLAHYRLESGGLKLAAEGNMPATSVTLTGTIRFPRDRWTSAKTGFKIRGGGLQFDKTGVFLMPGTQYLKETQ